MHLFNFQLTNASSIVLKSGWIITSLTHSRFCVVTYASPQSGTRFKCEQPFVGEERCVTRQERLRGREDHFLFQMNNYGQGGAGEGGHNGTKYVG